MSQIEKLLGTDAWLTLVLGAAFVAAFLVGVLLLSMRAKGRRRRSIRASPSARGFAARPRPAGRPRSWTM